MWNIPVFPDMKTRRPFWIMEDGTPWRAGVQQAANRALERGKIQRLPCWTCNAEKAEMHHANYHAPLDVIWLCRKCHEEAHRGI